MTVSGVRCEWGETHTCDGDSGEWNVGSLIMDHGENHHHNAESHLKIKTKSHLKIETEC